MHPARAGCASPFLPVGHANGFEIPIRRRGPLDMPQPLSDPSGEITMGRSVGTAAPAVAANVVKVSTSCTISLLTRPAGIRPGQWMMKGARTETFDGRSTVIIDGDTLA